MGPTFSREDSVETALLFSDAIPFVIFMTSSDGYILITIKIHHFVKSHIKARLYVEQNQFFENIAG